MKSATDLANLESIHRPRRCPYCGIDSVNAQTTFRRYIHKRKQKTVQYLLTILYDCFCSSCEKSFEISPDECADIETTEAAARQWEFM